MQALAVIFSEPKRLTFGPISLIEPGNMDVVVDVQWSGISAGTERLLWTGTMPPFPGFGYPLIPGYESVGRIVEAGSEAGRTVGEQVFIPGANCFVGARGLFGGAAQRLVVPSQRVVPIAEELGELGTLLALAATAHHIAPVAAGQSPDLIIGHGVVGRLLARLCLLSGAPAPVVWERDAARRTGAVGYTVIDPASDTRNDYARICDVSGDAGILDTLVQRLAPGGEIILGGFYADRLSFAFPPAFMREARLRIAAQWQSSDMIAVTDLITRGALSLDGIITHRGAVDQAEAAYDRAFDDSLCLKMVLDWRHLS